MKTRHLLFIYSLSLILLSLHSISAQDFLKTQGRQIVDDEGKSIIWRGMGLGGWMLQEGYMLNVPNGGAQYQIKADIQDLIGEEKTEEFYNAWLANHTTKTDVDSLASWGFNMIRLPMHYKLFTPPIEDEPVEGQITWIDKGFELTDNLLAWCKANNMYLILDLHAAPGGQGENADINDYDPSKPSLWESEANQDKMVALWKKLAERYKDEPMIAGYDIINEPNWGFTDHEADPNGCAEGKNEPLWDLQKRITTAIREVDSNHIIIIEGNCWGNNYNGLPTLWDDNLVLSFHKYWNGNYVGDIRGVLDLGKNRNVPIWLGETGENSNNWFTNAIKLVEENGVGWSWWPLKKMGSSNPLQINSNDQYQEILNYWADKTNNQKPSVETAYAGLMQLAEDTKIENAVYHLDVVDALTRQPYTTETKPYVKHEITQGGDNIVYAVDFDLGQNGVAYFDEVASNTSGNAGGSAWNSGYAYRNDGVDIEWSQDKESNGYNIGWTADGEWLIYTLDIVDAGNYNVEVRTASQGGGKASFSVDRTLATEIFSLAETGGYQNWENTTYQSIYLPKGRHQVKLNIDQGGFNLSTLKFSGPVVVEAQPKLYAATSTHGSKLITLTYNQGFKVVDNNGDITVTINGEITSISNVALVESNANKIAITLADSIFYGDEVLVSYTGTGIETVDAVKLAKFKDQNVVVNVAGGYVPHSIPGKMEAEAFIENNGFEIEGASDGSSDMGHTDVGDYLVYLVYVTQAGFYEVNYNVASESAGGSLKLQTIANDDELTKVSEVYFQKTGGWQEWETKTGSRAYLPEGIYKIRLEATASQFNINWLEFNFMYENEPTGVGIKHALDSSAYLPYPNPSSGAFEIKWPEVETPEKITITDSAGKKLVKMKPQKNAKSVEINEKLSPGLYFIHVEARNGSVVQKILIK